MFCRRGSREKARHRQGAEPMPHAMLSHGQHKRRPYADTRAPFERGRRTPNSAECALRRCHRMANELIRVAARWSCRGFLIRKQPTNSFVVIRFSFLLGREGCKRGADTLPFATVTAAVFDFVERLDIFIAPILVAARIEANPVPTADRTRCTSFATAGYAVFPIERF